MSKVSKSIPKLLTFPPRAPPKNKTVGTPKPQNQKKKPSLHQSTVRAIHKDRSRSSPKPQSLHHHQHQSPPPNPPFITSNPNQQQEEEAMMMQTLDPISLLLSFNDNLSQPENMERGPRYNAYAALRESKLRSNNSLYLLEDDDNEEYPQILLSKQHFPPAVKKQVSFASNVPRRKGTTNACHVAQSVPDFTAVLRREKENRKPPARAEMMTPPGKGSGVLSRLEGSRSASSVVEKKKSRVGMMMMMSARKSYASLDELKGLSSIAASGINGGGGGGGGGGRVVRSTARNVYGFRPL